MRNLLAAQFTKASSEALKKAVRSANRASAGALLAGKLSISGGGVRAHQIVRCLRVSAGVGKNMHQLVRERSANRAWPR